MVHQLVGAKLQLGHTPDSRHECRNELGLELTVQLGAFVTACHVAADVGVEQDGIGDAVGVGSVDAQAHIAVDADAAVHNAEINGRCGPELVVQNFLGVEVVHALILARVSAVGEALSDCGKGLFKRVAEFACENARFTGAVPCEFARFGADLRNLPLIHDNHALSVRHGDAGAVGNDVVVPLGVGGAAGSLLLSPHDQRVFIQSIAVEEFLPLVGKHAASRAESRLNQSHTNVTPFRCSLPSVPEGFVTSIIQDFTVFVNCFVKHCRSLRVLLASPGTCLPPCATAPLKERQNCHNISRHITQYSHYVHKYMVEYEHRVCCPWRDL